MKTKKPRRSFVFENASDLNIAADLTLFTMPNLAVTGIIDDNKEVQIDKVRMFIENLGRSNKRKDRARNDLYDNPMFRLLHDIYEENKKKWDIVRISPGCEPIASTRIRRTKSTARVTIASTLSLLSNLKRKVFFWNAPPEPDYYVLTSRMYSPSSTKRSFFNRIFRKKITNPFYYDD